MGKGTGRGQGSGRAFCFAVALCLVLAAGPVLLGVGISYFVKKENIRADNIATVQSAVTAWSSSSSPNGWQQFKQLKVYATLNSPYWPQTVFGWPYCPPYTVALQPDTSAIDVYEDEAATFQSVPQMRLTATGINYTDFNRCERQVSFSQQVNGSSANVSLAALPAFNDNQYYTWLQLNEVPGPKVCSTMFGQCLASDPSYQNCSWNCKNYFGGVFGCAAGYFSCGLYPYINSYAIKVAFNSTTGKYATDFNYPGAGGGANVVPCEYQSQYQDDGYYINGGVADGPIFQLMNYTFNSSGLVSGQPPSAFTLMVRSSADPWLAYMQATNATGNFGEGERRPHKKLGLGLLIPGAVLTALWLIFIPCLAVSCGAAQRPEGLTGLLWDVTHCCRDSGDSRAEQYSNKGNPPPEQEMAAGGGIPAHHPPATQV